MALRHKKAGKQRSHELQGAHQSFEAQEKKVHKSLYGILHKVPEPYGCVPPAARNRSMVFFLFAGRISVLSNCEVQNNLWPGHDTRCGARCFQQETLDTNSVSLPVRRGCERLMALRAIQPWVQATQAWNHATPSPRP